MKIKINRNILWAKIFIEQLQVLGVQYACVSPGSRSTPLTYNLAKNKKIKTYINIDERSSAFFALGLAKITGKPVLIVTTSGTAVAELYPAIVEAYQQRVPLIICTADRPPELIGTGANQTINQHNIFKNHIRWFSDVGLPSITAMGFQRLQRVAIKAFNLSLTLDKGPVHLNFPFRKPLEPNSFTDTLNKSVVNTKPQKVSIKKQKFNSIKPELRSSVRKLIEELRKYAKGLIIIGPMDYDPDFIMNVKKLSILLKYPVFVDGLSQLKFYSPGNGENLVKNFNSLLSSKNFSQSRHPDIILQFGRTPTSLIVESFLAGTSANRYIINSYGDQFDPSGTAKATFALKPELFCRHLLSNLKANNLYRPKSKWLSDFKKADDISRAIKKKIIEKAKFPSEPALISEILKNIPNGGSVFIGNSLPVRDLDNFSEGDSNRIIFYFSRGASGIDGITSTALGVAVKQKFTVLLTGDLSFLHDINALMIAKNYSIPLVIVVINNKGGGIFESLPIAAKFKNIREYFVTPHDLELENLVKSFGINYHFVEKQTQLKQTLQKCLNKKNTSVIEIQTDAVKSLELRNKYFSEVSIKLNKEFSE